MGMGRRTKIITEYRQTDGDADGDNIVGMGKEGELKWWGSHGDGYNIFYRVILYYTLLMVKA